MIEQKLAEIDKGKDKSDETVWCSSCGKMYNFIHCPVKYHLEGGVVIWRCLGCPDPRVPMGTKAGDNASMKI